MRWETVTTNASNVLEYRLMQDNKTRINLKYNSLQHTVRISSNEAQRLFFIHQHAGIFKSKTIFKNEYGIEVGKLSSDKWHGNHFTLELESKKYHIIYRNNPLVKIVVFTKSIDQPLLTCSINTENKIPGISFGTEDTNAVSSLLLALCWYLIMPVAKENVVEFA